MSRLIIGAVLASALFWGASEIWASKDNDRLAGAKLIITDWIALVDAGHYGESYDRAERIFQTQLSRTRWITAMTDAREPFGAPVSRALQETKYTVDLPEAPPGEYVFTRFKTQFEKGPPMMEIASARLQPDGTWRVAGYSIQHAEERPQEP